MAALASGLAKTASILDALAWSSFQAWPFAELQYVVGGGWSSGEKSTARSVQSSVSTVAVICVEQVGCILKSPNEKVGSLLNWDAYEKRSAMASSLVR